jgi:hypothetical protein
MNFLQKIHLRDAVLTLTFHVEIAGKIGNIFHWEYSLRLILHVIFIRITKAP